jgi:hypothetical protein
LGILSYHLAYTDHFAHAAKPLTDLTAGKSTTDILWSEEHARAFLTLKDKLYSMVALSVPRLVGYLFSGLTPVAPLFLGVYINAMMTILITL